MTASWDTFGAAPRPRRIRGGEIPHASATSWREEQRHARLALVAQRKAAAAEPVSDQPRVGLRIGRLWLDADGLFAFGLFLPMVFLVQSATMGAAVIAGLTPLYLFVRRKQLPKVLAPRLFLLAFPALAVCSVVWSDAPKDTLRYALELCITIVAALLLSSARDQQAVLRGIALAFMIYVADAVAVGGRVAVGLTGDAFSGLTDSKNLMADIASTGLIVSGAVIMMSLRERKWLWVALFAVGILMEAYCVMAARSAGALLGLALGLTPLLVLTPLVGGPKVLRAWLTSTVALVLLVIGLNFSTIAQAMMNLGASLFDKDPTLTGRTYLWYRAADLIREKPVLGRGYFSFWLQGNIDAEGLWRYGGIVERSGFNFHNTLVDLLVTVGWLGAAVLIATVAIGAVALVRRFINRPSLPMVFWIAILLYELSRTPIETLGIQPFYFSTTLVFAALGAAFGRLPAARAAHRPLRSAIPVQVIPLDEARSAWSNPRLAPARGSFRVLRNDQFDR
ncbi:MAG: Lipid core - O-antigen ligase-like protein [Phenylobacterium sp.]|nr:Lipid core - O-antigen ligase-like protein [Phenylobacterium sp.]